MLQQIISIWPIVVFLMGLLIGIGRILHMIKTICDRLDGHDAKFQETATSMQTFITMPMCDRCRDACERRNSAQFAEIKSLLIESSDKRDDYVTALSDVSCRLGRIEGKLDK